LTVSGTVINLNAFGATVRLDSGELASAQASDVETHRAQYERSLTKHLTLQFLRHQGARRPTVTLLPQISDDHLEAQIASYLKSAEEREGERPAHERHFLRKKRRAAHWKTK
jgi:hypothetical protein